MKCWFHPETDAVGVCKSCGKALCKDCAVALEGGIFCRACVQVSGVDVVPAQDKAALAQTHHVRPRPSRLGGGFFMKSLLIVCSFAVIAGVLMNFSLVYGYVATFAGFIVLLILSAALGQSWIREETKKRTASHPITSFDQQGAYLAAFFILGFIGLIAMLSVYWLVNSLLV